jgi:hypothetical protein
VDGPAFAGSGVESAAEEPGNADSCAGQRSETWARQVRSRRHADLWIGIPVAGDLRSGGRGQDATAGMRNDHEKVVTTHGMRSEANTQQPAHRYVVWARQRAPRSCAG